METKMVQPQGTYNHVATVHTSFCCLNLDRGSVRRSFWSMSFHLLGLSMSPDKSPPPP